MCDGIQHLDINNQACIFTKCIKCQNIIFNLKENEYTLNNEMELYGYPKKKICDKILNKLDKINKNRDYNERRIEFKKLLKLLSYDYSVKFLNDNQDLINTMKRKILNNHCNNTFDCTKYFKYIFNEDISNYID